MIGSSCVLIVDRSHESREVLRTALARHGLRVLEANVPGDGLALARLHRPDVIVLDLDVLQADKPTAGDFADVAENEGGKLIVLGENFPADLPFNGKFFAKPYHYGPLILRIEELLRQRSGRAAA